MRRKNIKLEWYAMEHDFNKNEIYRFNVFCVIDTKELVKKIVSKKITNYEELKEWLKRQFMYYYWSKAEREIIVGGLFAKENEDFEKVDVWYQLEPNMDRITEYVIREMKLDYEAPKK